MTLQLGWGLSEGSLQRLPHSTPWGGGQLPQGGPSVVPRCPVGVWAGDKFCVFVCPHARTQPHPPGHIWPLLQMWLWPCGCKVVSAAGRKTTEECAALGDWGLVGLQRGILLSL